MFRTVCLGLALSLSSLALAEARPAPDGFVELTKRLSPSVVNISTAQTVDFDSETVPAFPEGSPLERFNDFFGNRRGRDGRVARSLGSGFLIDDAGHIVTNNHVIDGADLIEVNFPDGDTYEASLVGRDPATDLAVLKISPREPIPHVAFGDSDAAEVGEWVIAIGNPFGYSGSVAAGIISARNRNIQMGSYDDFIQTDVAINQGNSGGPLFNMDGDVIGVNTAIISPSGGSVGISFSIPADLAQSVVKQLIDFGETRRGYMGLRSQAVTPALARSYRLDEPKGAIIRSVVDGGPADEAGLRTGDLITRIGDREITDIRILYRAVAEAEIDTEVEVEYIRRRRTATTRVRIEQLAEDLSDEERLELDVEQGAGEVTVGGLSVEALTRDVRRTNRLHADTKGVRVVSVARNSQASGKILTGDIIEEVAFEAVTSPREFQVAMEAALNEEETVTLLINRGGNYIFYAIDS
ncbi:Do family serine endopeptidase [Algimonas porphyrae]|uniref:Serine protease n=1 Tax=Algimonas porphyrae TaxID=1128113 RepID=A0ABQ5UX63_9PROT|nr:Do family serine endopeptidase [Algimonas porphyrae]GLQ19315.1 serine protease [Algimonas porphyrae]